MNIFILSTDPTQAARWLCDSHVIKMTLESAQMLCTAHWLTGGKAPYRPTHAHHPCNKWVMKSKENYRWLLTHALAISAEYTERYGKVHKSQPVLEWAANNTPPIPSLGLTPFALAMNKEKYGHLINHADPVSSYRAFYKADKARFATWKQNKPSWW